MLIHGLQKMTLLDFPGLVACTVFFGGCDMRCPFCHNSQLARGEAPPLMDDRDLVQFLGRRKGLVDGVCFSGGEPLLRAELPDLLREVREMGFKVKLDTNGTHPAGLSDIIDAGLVDYVAMDVKNDEARYPATAGVDVDLGAIRESIATLLRGAVDYEFRTTVATGLHDDASFHGIGKLVAGAKRHFLQPFVERDTVPDKTLATPSEDDMRRYLAIARAYVPAAAIRGM